MYDDTLLKCITTEVSFSLAILSKTENGVEVVILQDRKTTGCWFFGGGYCSGKLSSWQLDINDKKDQKSIFKVQRKVGERGREAGNG